MTSFEHVIRNPIGLHARPAGLLTRLAKAHSYDINISFKERTVRADRTLQVVSLGAITGDTIIITIHGNLCDEDIRLIKDFFIENV